MSCTGGDFAYTSPIQITVENVSVNLGNDTMYCEGNAGIVLNAGNPGSTYLWNDNSTSQTLTVNTAGSYSVLVTSPNGCTDQDTIVVGFTPLATGDFTTNELNGGVIEFSATATGTNGYYWMFGHNSATGTGPNVSYTYPNNGFYTVTLNLVNDCGDTTKVTKSVTVTKANVGINDIINTAKVTIYPNPAQGILNIKNESDYTLEHIRLTDLLGKVIAHQKLSSSVKTYNLDVSKLSAGAYILEINTTSGKIIKPFVKH